MMLPMVTGNRFENQNARQVNRSRFGIDSATDAVKAGSNIFIASAYGMKYILAMLCSKPAATNAVIGKIIAAILSSVLRALKVNQTARHTNPLQRMPSATACKKSRSDLAAPIRNAVTPTEFPPKVYCFVKNIRITVPMAPTKLPA